MGLILIDPSSLQQVFDDFDEGQAFSDNDF